MHGWVGLGLVQGLGLFRGFRVRVLGFIMRKAWPVRAQIHEIEISQNLLMLGWEPLCNGLWFQSPKSNVLVSHNGQPTSPSLSFDRNIS